MAYRKGHCTGHKRERRPTQRTRDKAAAMALAIAQQLANTPRSELLNFTPK